MQSDATLQHLERILCAATLSLPWKTGGPHEEWGERPKAFVTLKDDAEATEVEIIAFCRDQIAHFKCPDAVEFGDLPKTSTGKIQKYVLREREWVDREKRIN